MAKDKVRKVNVILGTVLWANMSLETEGRPCKIYKKNDIIDISI